MTTQIMTADIDPAPPATTPPLTPEQHDADAKALHIVICRMRRLAPSLLLPLLTVARSMMRGDGK